MNLEPKLERDPGGSFVPAAVYFLDSDCVEYVKEDAFCVYERIDDFLTLIMNATGCNLVGFKLKGFKYVFRKHLEVKDDLAFIELASAIEAVFTKVGNMMFSVPDEARERAYKDAKELAVRENVRLQKRVLEAA
jgi:hypothetical protein